MGKLPLYNMKPKEVIIFILVGILLGVAVAILDHYFHFRSR